MIEWLRRMLQRPPRDRFVERLTSLHDARVAKVAPTVGRAHEVAGRILGEKFADADRAAFGQHAHRPGHS